MGRGKRKETPDILGGILGNPQPTARGGHVVPPPPPLDKKTKATYYLAADTAKALDAAWLVLRGMCSEETRTQVSKSAIVDAALQIVFADLDADGERSQLASMLVDQ